MLCLIAHTEALIHGEVHSKSEITTMEVAKHSQPGGQFYGIHELNDSRIMIFAGGIPLRRNGKVVGAIGVSGRSGEQDQVVAEADAAAFLTQAKAEELIYLD
jgi:uncharacterized protein GlcG (DUF336 family)